jgi:hypothetical protein
MCILVSRSLTVQSVPLRRGIRDGLNGKWMFTFGAITELPDERDLPFSICVDRSDLQDVLLEEIGNSGVVQMSSAIAEYRNHTKEVGLHKLNSIYPEFESAWFQPLNLKCELLVSPGFKVCFRIPTCTATPRRGAA